MPVHWSASPNWNIFCEYLAPTSFMNNFRNIKRTHRTIAWIWSNWTCVFILPEFFVLSFLNLWNLLWVWRSRRRAAPSSDWKHIEQWTKRVPYSAECFPPYRLKNGATTRLFRFALKFSQSRLYGIAAFQCVWTLCSQVSPVTQKKNKPFWGLKIPNKVGFQVTFRKKKGEIVKEF